MRTEDRRHQERLGDSIAKCAFALLLLIATSSARDRHIIYPAVRAKDTWINSHQMRIVVLTDTNGFEYTIFCDSRDSACVPVVGDPYPMYESQAELCTDKPNVEVNGHTIAGLSEPDDEKNGSRMPAVWRVWQSSDSQNTGQEFAARHSFD